MKLIFWDIDGVANTPPIWGKWARDGFAAALDPVLVQRAMNVTRLAGAKAVLSSSWRHNPGFKETLAALYDNGWATATEDFIGYTPFLLSGKRGSEIAAFLAEHHPEQDDVTVLAGDIVIVDDMASGYLEPFGTRLVRTDFEIGLTIDDCTRILTLLPPESPNPFGHTT